MKQFKILGIHAFSHDIGACLIADNKITAISEERLVRIKYGNGGFPEASIKYLLDNSTIKNINEIDLIVADHLGREANKVAVKAYEIGYRGKIHFIKHHDAHASSAFFVSPFIDSAILIVDGCGSFINENNSKEPLHYFSSFLPDMREVQSLYRGVNSDLVLIKRTYNVPNYQFGIGMLYGFASMYVGFGELEGGKLMALAAYGKRTNLFKSPFFIDFEGELLGFGDKDPLKLENMVYLGKKIFKGLKPRKKDESLKQSHVEIARYVQDETQNATIQIAKRLYEITQSNNLCIAGGFGLNCITNSLILEQTPFKNVFIQPASTDCGIPLGCALFGYHVINKMPRNFIMETTFLGRNYTENEILSELNRVNNITYSKPKDLFQIVAKQISDGKIIGWFEGGSEFGPRALGHRSILADPRNKNIKKILDEKVKNRESFRPYAPSVLQEFVSEYFYIEHKSPFMLFAPKVKEEKRGLIPAVVHIDGTSRLQTVNKKDNPRFYKLIKEFYNLTKIPMLLNTSFNRAGEPIVETPNDALKCFLNTEIDFLVMENFLVKKKR